MLEKKEIIHLLNEKGISFEMVEHPESFTMEEIHLLDLPYPDRSAKNVFVHDRKKRNYFLVTISGAKKVDLHQIREEFETTRLSFASDEDLKNILGVAPGSASPFSLLNDQEKKTHFVLDRGFLAGNEIIAAHPNDNTATIYLNVYDLLQLLTEFGHDYTLLELA